jgi:enediyne biosynthesis protein E3
MAGLRAFRRSILTPNVTETKLSTRGFTEKDTASRELLETIGETFLKGYAYAVEAPAVEAAEERLEEIPARFRGFAYEGAAMGLTVLDGLPFGGSRRLASLLAGRGNDHIYMAYVGIGWAMARLPRFRWSRIQAPDPLLRWLVLDGYGFHQAYFSTDRYVHAQYREPRFPWPGGEDGAYADRAIDQGIGRAMWFVGGTDPDLVADLIDRFPESRRSDLYSGAGLAATYAGGVDEDELRTLVERAGPYADRLAQGSAFAAKARIRAGLLVPHTELATRILCGLSAADAAGICDRQHPVGRAPNGVPAYEAWRRGIAAECRELGGVGR